MQMHWIDWGIILILPAIMIAVAVYTKKYTRSVADFLAAGRCARRYLISTADGIAALGAISIVCLFEVFYSAGFSAFWWTAIPNLVMVVIALSGWVVYRFRATRALTMAQFFEIRYSKKFRIFAGLLAWVCGIINFGIFPAVGGRFFLYFCGLPETIPIFGFGISTFVLLMIVLLSISLFCTLTGGQVTVIVTDFMQGFLCFTVFAVITVVALTTFSWSQITEALAMAPENASLVNPFQTSDAKDFNLWFYLIVGFTAFYHMLAWQGNQGYNASALNPHEAKMGKILGVWRGLPLNIFILLVPVCAYTLMHHPDFAEKAESVKAVLAGIENQAIQTQMTVPVAMSHFLSKGFIGAVCAVLLAAFISTNDTYLHSWGSILVQDVIVPLREKPLSPGQHIWLLRLSIFGVAVFIFIFSLVFRQTEYIAMFFAITGAIFLGGAGAVIVGGLYWKKGTTAAAWTALLAGAVLAVAGMTVDQLWPMFNDGAKFPINGQWKMFIISACCIVLYIIISLLDKKSDFNLDRMLHRGKYAIADDDNNAEKTSEKKRSWLTCLGIGKEFTFIDKVIYIGTIAWTFMWTAIFIVGTIYNLVFDVKTESWEKYWRFYVVFMLISSIITVIWFAIGGLRDLSSMFGFLGTAKRNALDDGTVVDHKNQDE